MLVYFFRPDKAATFSRLSRYEGSHGLNQVEDEMANRVFVQSGPFYITEHYMIALAGAETQILPLSSIVWLYRHSSFFKLFHHHLKPTYHLAFMDEYGKIYETSSKEKEDTTAVIRAIRKYRPDVLIGYTQENREEAKKRIKKNENSV